MGTRNLTMVIHEGQTKVAQYGQWDGYPSGQGTTALEFLSNPSNINKLILRLKDVRFATTDEIEANYKSIGVTGGWLSQDQSAQFNKLMPFLSRDHGADILNRIVESQGEVLLNDSSSFAADSLMCEWAYVIDLDGRCLEVYSGFNTNPLTEGERFASLEKDGKYYPIKMIKKYQFDDLPDQEKFCEELGPSSEE